MMKIADLRKKVRIFIIGKPILSRIASIIKNIYLSKSMKIEIEKVIAEHSTQEQINDKKLMRSIKRDILFMDFYCYLDPMEYFRYNIYGRPLKIKKEYIGAREVKDFQKKLTTRNPNGSSTTNGKRTVCFRIISSEMLFS